MNGMSRLVNEFVVCVWWENGIQDLNAQQNGPNYLYRVRLRDEKKAFQEGTKCDFTLFHFPSSSSSLSLSSLSRYQTDFAQTHLHDKIFISFIHSFSGIISFCRCETTDIWQLFSMAESSSKFMTTQLTQPFYTP